MFRRVLGSEASSLSMSLTARYGMMFHPFSSSSFLINLLTDEDILKVHRSMTKDLLEGTSTPGLARGSDDAFAVFFHFIKHGKTRTVDQKHLCNDLHDTDERPYGPLLRILKTINDQTLIYHSYQHSTVVWVSKTGALNIGIRPHLK